MSIDRHPSPTSSRVRRSRISIARSADRPIVRFRSSDPLISTARDPDPLVVDDRSIPISRSESSDSISRIPIRRSRSTDPDH